ncbi:Kinesin-like protein kif21b [Rhizoclosmatium sp. JEL0117]|nr:Kinesin-like protein kif21b [Rhizoclosmatium sp. JEL0117]
MSPSPRSRPGSTESLSGGKGKLKKGSSVEKLPSLPTKAIKKQDDPSSNVAPIATEPLKDAPSNINNSKNTPPSTGLSRSSSLKNLISSVGDSPLEPAIPEDPNAEEPSQPEPIKSIKPVNATVAALTATATHSRSASASSTKTNFSNEPLSYDQQAIKVVVRIRNTALAGPASMGPTPELETCMGKTGNRIDITDPTGEKGSKPFYFDTIFAGDTQQEEVYGVAVEPLIRKCLEGYNGCIFAYGQTAAGKTHTMQGPANRIAESLSETCTSVHSDIGIISRVVHQLNNHVKEHRGRVDEASGNCLDFVIKVSYLEIYNEGLIDLLVDKDKQENLKIRMETGTTSGKDLYVQNLTEKHISSIKDYLKVLTTGAKNRSIGETNMNAQSSRSHAILTITIDQYLVEPRKPQSGGVGTLSRSESTASLAPEIASLEENSPEMLQKIGQGKKRSKIHLIDLAGSERADSTGATGDRLKEGAQINQSLSALGNVISALTSPSSSAKHHVPYRDSKLTYLLSDSLGGNALTLMITCCSPVSKNYSESISTLRFAERVKKVVNKAVVNMDPHLLKIAELEAEVLALKTRLANCTCGGQGGGDCDVHSPVTSASAVKPKDEVPETKEVDNSVNEEKEEIKNEEVPALDQVSTGQGLAIESLDDEPSLFVALTTQNDVDAKEFVEVGTDPISAASLEAISRLSTADQHAVTATTDTPTESPVRPVFPEPKDEVIEEFVEEVEAIEPMEPIIYEITADDFETNGFSVNTLLENVQDLLHNAVSPVMDTPLLQHIANSPTKYELTAESLQKDLLDELAVSSLPPLLASNSTSSSPATSPTVPIASSPVPYILTATSLEKDVVGESPVVPAFAPVSPLTPIQMSCPAPTPITISPIVIPVQLESSISSISTQHQSVVDFKVWTVPHVKKTATTPFWETAWTDVQVAGDVAHFYG